MHGNGEGLAYHLEKQVESPPAEIWQALLLGLTEVGFLLLHRSGGTAALTQTSPKASLVG